MADVRVLLAGGDADTKAALEGALASSRESVDLVHVADAEDALMTLVSERFQVCLLRAYDRNPDFALGFCRDALESGVRIPIIALMDADSIETERTLLDAGVMAALPWTGGEAALIRNLVHLTLSLRQSAESLRQANDRLVMEMRTLQDERERAEAVNVEYVALAEDYAIAKEQLEKLNQEKNKFFSIIAHDLRSPFTALLGFAGILAERGDKLAPEKVKGYATHVLDAGNRVFKLLENLLEWSRLQMDRVRPEPAMILLSDVAHKTIDVLGPVAQQKSIQLLERGEAPKAFADPHMVDAVIRNLVNNAIKFTPEGGVIAITYHVDEADGIALVGVQDTGVGMDEATAAKLFKLSETVTTQGTAGEPGTGLGLLLCKELVERNGGKISVMSRPGKGSTFTFSLPLKPPAEAQAQAEAQRQAG